MGKKAMIFAAGMGTRLKPLTDRMPKALVPVCGKPLLRIVMEKLAAAGYSEVVVNVHHFADQIEEYLASGNDLGMQVSISDERDLLRETGGGILHAAPLLGTGRFLVHNVDILSNLDLERFEASVPGDALASLVVSRRKTSRYLLFDDAMRLVGWTNVSTGEVRSPYPDLDPASCRAFAFSGIHSISSDIFRIFREEGFSGKFPIMDFYLKVAERHPVYGYVPDGFRMLDVGKLDSLDEAARLYREFSSEE